MRRRDIEIDGRLIELNGVRFAQTVKSNQDQRVINSSAAAMSAKQSSAISMLEVSDTSIEVISSPEKYSPSKKASDHSINHIISLPPTANNNKSTMPTQYKSNTANANSASFNSFDGMKSKSQPPKPSPNSNIVGNHSKATMAGFKHHVESTDKFVHVIKDSSSEDEVQIVDDKPKHVAFASSSSDAKAIKQKRDKIRSNSLQGNAKPRKSILKASPHSTRDPLAEDDDIRNAESTMKELKELSVNT